jgi:ubiquinone/menaquinone biosynthesis C-methylase UbiE
MIPGVLTTNMGDLELKPGVFSRLAASAYDSFQAKAEKEVFARRRRDLLQSAKGRVLEMGAGTGANLPQYPRHADLELVLAEPDPGMLARAVKRAQDLGLEVEFQQVGAYPLPFADGSFDTAVYCICLCTIPDPARALAEAHRVLRPGGRLLFLEHVRSRDPKLARWQDRMHGPWKIFGRGCHCNRDTRSVIEASELTISSIEESTEKGIPVPIVRPMIAGIAEKRRT